MGLLDWFRRRGAPGVGAAAPPGGGLGIDVGVPPGAAAEGPPVGASDPGSFTGEDDVLAAHQDDFAADAEGEPEADAGP